MYMVLIGKTLLNNAKKKMLNGWFLNMAQEPNGELTGQL